MTDRPPDPTSKGPLRALFNWLTGAAPPLDPTPSFTPSTRRTDPPARIAHYAVTTKLGEGGMGVVYAARDEKLERAVALKTMSSVASDETARRRFWREARAAASVNHPNICQIYEIGEDRGELFIAMELLEGQSLADRLREGAMSVAEAVPIALEMLAALTALHARGIVHRDLKPSNVFLTRHGVKLLDFGLARPELPGAVTADVTLTRSGSVLGTPRYMAPEQVTGDPIDARTDLFAVGAIMFEMLAGRPAFTGRTVVEILHGTMYEQPPALSGSPAVAAVDRVIRRALAKKPADRPTAAADLARDLEAVRGVDSDTTAAVAQALTRLVVLPFRVLRPDPESDFLAYSLADAIATSLSGIGSLIVRSSAVAARFAAEAPDLKALAADADVDRVVMGTILRSGDQLRVTAQLVEAPGGTLLTAQTVQSSMGDLFHLQDDLARRIVESLALPLGGAAATPRPDAPGSARAYELYLRANELSRTYDGFAAALALYERCVELDPHFAPAWAQLGRCVRVVGKFIVPTPGSDARAEQALQRALELNPRLSLAHKFYANLEADLGLSVRALTRLLDQARRHGNDPELFAGLVHACRYCGLFEESMAAHREARRLDPNVPTSIDQTYCLMGALADLGLLPAGDRSALGDGGIRLVALGLAGRVEEARQLLPTLGDVPVTAFRAWTRYLTSWLDRQPDAMQAGIDALDGLTIQQDPEAVFEEGWLFCDVEQYDRGLAYMRRAIDRGYFPVPTLETARQFDPLRGSPAFQALLGEAIAGRDRARAAFREAGGDRLLGR